MPGLFTQRIHVVPEGYQLPVTTAAYSLYCLVTALFHPESDINEKKLYIFSFSLILSFCLSQSLCVVFVFHITRIHLFTLTQCDRICCRWRVCYHDSRLKHQLFTAIIDRTCYRWRVLWPAPESSQWTRRPTSLDRLVCWFVGLRVRTRARACVCSFLFRFYVSVMLYCLYWYSRHGSLSKIQSVFP